MRSPSKAMLCSKLAIATALVVGATPAMAQGVNGSVTGSVGIGAPSTSGNTTTINVTSQQAVVDWSATGPSGGGLTTFQNSAQTLTFQSGSNFAVLNNVSPTVSTNAIYMNGTVNSLVSGQVGGTVYFYSPNGVVIGDSGRINVGSLGLTTSPIASDGQGNWMTGFGTASPKVTFGPAAAGSYVRIDNTAEVNAHGSGNYVALVAPHVALNGTIRTDGAAALVGAAAATITFRTSNLYDIQVTTGSSDGAGVVVNGGTIARNSPTIGGNHRAYLVAVPANTAMTMLVQSGSELGFDIAGSAGVEGNAVVLSAGRGIFNGEGVGQTNAPAASITIDNAAFTSNVRARSSDKIEISSGNGATSFSGSLTAEARNLVRVRATGGLLTVGGNLTANADHIADDARAGDVAIGAYNGATMTVAQNVALSAGGFGFSASSDNLDAGNGTGGNVLIQASGGGTLSIGGTLSAAADGTGGAHGFSNAAAGNGMGGLVQILANDSGSSVTVSGATILSATGVGGSTVNCSSCLIRGGNGEGGQIDVNGAFGTGMSLSFGASLSLDVDGEGGSGDVAAGNGQGGDANVSSADGTTINIARNLAISADGSGGYNSGAGAGGSGTGGNAYIGGFNGAGGAIDIGAAVRLSAVGSGGVAAGIGAGGAGSGGDAVISAPGVTVKVGTNPDFFSQVLILADGEGGSSAGGTGGIGDAGKAALSANGAGVTVNGAVRLSAIAGGGSGLVGGNAVGGLAELIADNGATLTIIGSATQYAYAQAGNGGFGIGGSGGFGDGGEARVSAYNNGTVDLTSLDSDVGAIGGDGSTAGSALGGDINIVTLSGGDIDLEQLFATANGGGGYGDDGNGGEGEGGTISVNADNGTIRIDNLVNPSASGLGGGTGGATTSGGLGVGGSVAVGAANGGTLTALGSFSVYAQGNGGGAFAAGATGGNGEGGSVSLAATGVGSTINARFAVTLDASGTGGSGECGDCIGGGGGGNGSGGTATMQTSGGLGNRILVGDVKLYANGTGGAGVGGAGGDGDGGDAIVTLDNGLIDVAGDLTLEASGSGGYQSNGGVAGNGAGGDAAITLAGSATALLSVSGTTLLDTDGYGGGAGIIGGGTAGDGSGGFSRIEGSGGRTGFPGAVTITANGIGGNAFGGAGGDGVGGQAWVESRGADIDFDSNLSLTAISTGGNGMTGGNALAFIGASPKDTSTTDARILAFGGSVTVLGATSLDVSAHGGNGSNGGAGGNASSGFAAVHAGNNDLGAATITLGDLAINASVTGGAGGTGIGGNVGGNGGAGGFATGGFIAPTASAGNGRLIIGNVTIDGTAAGGAGGAGGNGGVGGSATGAKLYIGTESGEAAALLINQGSASFASISSNLGAVGGAGGNGATNGIGGAGGAALGGDGNLAARGSLVTVGNVTFTGHATGGAGGLNSFGAVSGVGGEATAGGLGIGIANRFGNTAMRGTINAGAVSMSATATGGAGSTAGSGYAGGRNFFGILNGDATLASFSMLSAGSSGGDPDAVLDPFTVINGTAVILGNFTVVNPATMSLMMDGGSLSVGGNLSISAGNFIHDSVNPPPTSLGTVSGGTISLVSDRDVIVDANLLGRGKVLIDAGGLVDVRNLTTAGGTLPGDITVVAGSTINALTVNADGGVDMLAGGNISLGNVTGGTISLVSDRDVIVDANLLGRGNVLIDAGGLVDVRSLTTAGGTLPGDISVMAGSTINALTVNANGGVDMLAGGTVRLGNVVGGTISLISDRDVIIEADLLGRGDVLIDAGGLVDVRSLTTAGGALPGDITVVAGSTINALTVNADGGVDMLAGGNIRLGNVNGGLISLISDRDVVVDANLLSRGNVLINAGGLVDVRSLTTAGGTLPGDITVVAGGTINSLTVNADGGVDMLAGGTVRLGNVSGGTISLVSDRDVIVDANLLGRGNVLIDAGGLVNVRNLTTAGGTLPGDITLVAGSTIDALTVNADGGVDMLAGGNIRLGNVSGRPIEIASTGGAVDTGHLTSVGSFIAVDASGAITTDNVAGNQVELVAGGAIGVNNVTAAVNHATLDAGSKLTAGVVAANGAVTLLAGGLIATGPVTSTTSSILADAVGNANLGALTARNNITLDAGGTLTGGTVSAGGGLFASSAGALNLSNIRALTASVSGLSVTLGSVTLTGLFDARSDSFFLSEDITTGESLVIDVVGNITTKAITTPKGILLDAGANISTGALSARDVDFVAVGNIGVTTATVGEQFSLEAGGTINAGNITAGNSIEFEAAGAVVAGNLSAGLVNPNSAVGAEYNVGVVSTASVSLGNVAARGWVGIGTFGTVNVGSINSGDDVLILADGNVTSGAITTGAQRRLLIADADMVARGGGVDNFDRSIVFGAVDGGTGVATTGSVTLGGPVSSRQVDMLVGGSLTSGAITADRLLARVSGTANINGAWNIGSSIVRSNDISIGAGGGINGSEIVLLSTNATQTLIGDGLSGTGYALSNSEFGTLDADRISVLGNSASSAAIDTLVGNLTLRSPGLAGGAVTLGTAALGNLSAEGNVRVVGSVTGSGFGATGQLRLTADRVEVEATTATIALTGQPGVLGGALIFDADRVHVAEARVLDLLAVDPNYADRNRDLSTAPTVQRPDGVVRAGEIYVDFSGSNVPHSLLVQNLGPRAAAAGFVANYAEVVTANGGAPIDMVVNGQLIIDGVTLTGVEVRDALMEDDDPARFTATSTINGCPLTGDCILIQEPPPINPTPDIQTQFSLINLPGADDLLFGNEEAIEDNEEDGGEDSASSPIQPPAPLFNTKPLEVAGETDEPVSGGGNPALIGNGENPDEEEDDDEEDE